MGKASLDDIYAAVGQIQKNGGTPDDAYKAIQDGGYDLNQYKQFVAAKKSGDQPSAYSSGGPLGGGAMEGFARGFLDTATFGTADELGAMLDATGKYVSDGGDFSKHFEASLERRRAGAADFAKKYPKATLGGNIAGGLAETPFLPGGGASKSVAQAAVKAAGGGALGGALYGLGSGEGAGDRIMRAAQGGIAGGITGGALGAAGYGIGQGAQTIAGRNNIPVADVAGNLTPEAGNALQNAVVDPRAVDPATAQEVAARLSGRQATPETVPATMRRVIAERHGVDLAGPQATRDIAGIGLMQGMSAGTRGSRAQGVVDQYTGGQYGQFNQAAANVAQNAAPGALGGYGESGTGGLIGDAVNKQADQAWQGVKQLYSQTGADQHVILDHMTRDLVDRIAGQGGAVDKAGFSAVTPQNAPGFSSILGTIKHYITGGDDLGAIQNNIQQAKQEIMNAPNEAAWSAAQQKLAQLNQQLAGAKSINPTLAGIDDVRKRVGEMARDPALSNTDRRMTQIALGEFDKWLDDTAANHPSAAMGQSLDTLKQARGAAKDWFKTYQRDPMNSGDTVGKTVEQIRNGNLDNQSLFDTLMGARTSFDEKALPAAMRVRDIVGDKSPEWQTLQQGMMRRIVFGDANKQALDFQPGEQAWKTMDTRISQALDGRGAELANQMLGSDTTTKLLQLREIARSLAIPRKAGNWSGTSYANQRAGYDTFKSLLSSVMTTGGAALGLHGGGPAGAVLGAGLGYAGGRVADVLRDVRGGAAARALTAPYAAPRLAAGIADFPLVGSVIPAGDVGAAMLDRARRPDLLGRE